MEITATPSFSLHNNCFVKNYVNIFRHILCLRNNIKTICGVFVKEMIKSAFFQEK